MIRPFIAWALILLFAPASIAGQVALDGQTFTLPDGFEVERVAGPPMVDRPIVADFDDRGRLYVADSSGSNAKVQEQLEERPHRIVRLEDTDGDGRFDRSTPFADGMMFPEGALWLDGSLYVAAPPSIWRLTDTDDDGVADRREEWFAGKTLTGCANDLHGPYAGPDGWIYWCKGAFAEQTYERPGRAPFVTRAAHIFRCRPDGSGIEPVMTGGMDNPVEVAFTPGGEPIFTTTFLQFPGGGRRDGLIHAVYGGMFGKVHNVLDGHPRTGPDLLPPLTHLGPAAPSGLARYESDAFGPDYHDNLFAALFNLQKVTRHVVEPAGATFASRDEDFLASDSKDFHPTDVLPDADGSLLVIDTGGWYKLCCPTSQLPKPDVLGAIYRVRRPGSKRVDDPRRLSLNWEAMSPAGLAGLLGDPRPAVRRRAVDALGTIGAEAIPDLGEVVRSAPSAEARRAAAWASCRIDDKAARDLAREALGDIDETVRQVALHAIALRRDAGATTEAIRLLEGPSIQNRRAAAEALGRIGGPAAVPALLAAASGGSDRFLDHSLIYALIEIDNPKAIRAGLDAPTAGARRAALIALEAMDGGGLEPDRVVTRLDDPDPATREAAWWIAGRHPEWGDALAGPLRAQLDARGLSEADREELEHRLARFALEPAVSPFLVDRLGDATASPDSRRIVLRAWAEAAPRAVPSPWIEAVSVVLGSASERPELLRQAVATVRAWPMPRDKEDAAALRRSLLACAGRSELEAGIRLGALAAVPGGLERVEPTVFAFLLNRLGPSRPVVEQMAAADALSRATLDDAQLLRLTGAIRAAGPLQIDRLLSAFTRTTKPDVGLALIEALDASPGRAALRAETLRPRLARFGPKVEEPAERLLAAIDDASGRQGARIGDLLASAVGGDVRRGQEVFNGSKAACVSCHAIGYKGGKVGPDLTRIGQVRDELDLLEAIVFPSASFVRSFEPVTVATLDGRITSGIIRIDAPDELVLAVGPNDEVARIPRDQVEAIGQGSVSLMPAGLDQQLTRQELADLVAFLRACR